MGILIQHQLRHLMRLKNLFCIPALTRLLALFSLVLLQLFVQLTVSSTAQAQAIGAEFDHNNTGFVLTTQHQSARCETCHIKGIFKGTPKTCEACHGWNNPRSSFVMPTNHIPTANQSCDTCHTRGLAKFVDANRAFNHALLANRISCNTCHDGTHPNVTTMPTPENDRSGVHASVRLNKTSCGMCHSSTSQFNGKGLPSIHIPIAASARCDSCHDMANLATMPSITAIHANAPDSGANCSQCHSAASAARFSSPHMVPPIVPPPANHIPMGSQSCESCHVGSNSSMTLPVVDGAKFTNSAFNHAGITSGCSTCHGSSVTASTFFGVSPKTQVGMNPPHVTNPGNASCEACHLNSIPSGLIPAGGLMGGQASFANGQFSHTGITTGCEACHGSAIAPNAYYGITLKTTGSLTPSHIPTTAACTSCHVNSIPSVPVPATGQTSGTTFANGQMDHSATTASCDTCHGSAISAASFYGISNIVVLPPTSPAGPSAHIPTSMACDVCHTKPVGAYPIASWPSNKTFQSPLATGSAIHTGISVGCNTCHDVSASSTWLGMNNYLPTRSGVSPNTQSRGFQVRPTANNHPTGGDCSLCHSSTVYFSAPTPPANHIPYATGVSCGTCHTDPNFLTVPTLATVPTIGVIHANIQSKTTNCVQCHSSENAAIYASSTQVRPIVTETSVSNHVPMGGLSCEKCHMDANSSITGAQVVDGDKFSKSAFSHTGSSGVCASCHADGTAFFGVSPKSTAGLAPAHVPNSGNQGCEACHATVPTMLIPATGATGTMTRFSAGVQYVHTGISTGCEACHGSTVTSASFYGITNIVVIPPTSPAGPNAHIPTNAACDVCHGKPTAPVGANATTGTGFQTPLPTGPAIHKGITGGCNTCHDVTASTTWIGMGKYQPTRTAGKSYGFQIRPTVNHPAGGDCSLCHTSTLYFSSPSAPANHIPYAATATCGSCHTDSTFMTVPTLATIPSIGTIHANIESKTTNCVQCHSVANAALYASSTTVRPIVTDKNAAAHIPMAGLGCESCHMGPNSSVTGSQVADGDKFSNSAFSHTGSSGVCATCHAGTVSYTGVKFKTTSGLSPAHIPNPGNLGCEACHATVPTMQIPATGATAGMTTFATNTKFSHSGISTGCAACHGASVNGGTFYGITSIVAIPPSTSAGTGSHIPTSASCETCHAGSTPTALVDANATRSAPGSGFQTPVPKAYMIHTGVAGNCASCHDTNMVWMGMDYYTISTSAPFKGFQTRPQSTAGKFFVADASHPGGECSNCHTSFDNFNGPSAPGNHIPYAAGVTCATCHGDFTSLPTIAKTHANIQSTSSNCAQCHDKDKSAYYSAGMKQVIKTVPDLHISMGSATCESCHVGAGSSVASTPVPDGALFSGSLFNHAGATASCATCHGDTVTAGTFKGIFPKTKLGLTPKHVPTSAACDACHATVPTGLVPSAGMATFATNTKFSHTGIATGCSTCHGAGIDGTSFYGITSLVVLPPTSPAGQGSHIPAPNNASCEACHKSTIPSGLVDANAASTAIGSTAFANKPSTQLIHSGVSGSCNDCHNNAMSWIGVGKYTPRSTTKAASGSKYYGFQSRPGMGGNYSIPDPNHAQNDLLNLDCSKCHQGFTFFGPPAAPTDHIPYKPGVECGACHTSFTTAPVAKGSASMHSNFLSNTSNCAQCHSVDGAKQYSSTTTTYPIMTPGSDHVPMGNLGCESCHVAANTISTFTSFANSSFSHSGIGTKCSECHGPNVTSLTFQGLPLIVSMGRLTPAHIPVNSNNNCDVCHTNSLPTNLVPASGSGGTPSFSGASFTHQYITDNCESCHGPAASGTAYAGIGINDIVRMPHTSPAGPTAHLPTSTVCANCHLAALPAGLINGVYAGSTPTGFRNSPPSANTIHTGVTGGCNSCHGQSAGYIGMDLSQYTRIPSSFVPNSPNTQYTGFQTRPQSTATGYSVANANHQTSTALSTGDCSKCHGSFAYFGQPTLPPGHIPYAPSASCSSCHTVWGDVPTKANIHANIQSTKGNCIQCHSADGVTQYGATISTPGGIKLASTTAPVHIPMRGLGCEACHTASNTMTTWTSFSGANFSHGNGMKTDCAECHGNGTGPFEGSPTIIKMPATTPTNTGAAHFPVTTTCESCHLTSMPAALMSGSATVSIPNSGFRTNAFPNSTQIHSGVSTCNSCHEKDMLWVGMSAYTFTTSAPFKGFQTRPYANPANPGSTINDAQHTTGGDCSSCHIGFTEWQAQVKPDNHIPTAANATCAACHVPVAGVTDYRSMPTHLSIHTNAPSTKINCAQCHSKDNALYYKTNYLTIKAPDDTHIDMAGQACETCHVGTANTSITTTPVGDNKSFGSSAFVHKASTKVCADCHGTNILSTTFQGGLIPKSMAGLNPVHVPNPANKGCDECHQTPAGQVRADTATTTFATNTVYSHSGITTGCDACHGSSVGASNPYYGIARIVYLSNYTATSGAGSHIPAPNNASCEACHYANTPSGKIAVSATTTAVAWGGNSGFYTPAPLGKDIHSAVKGNCSLCHEAPFTWTGMAKYPIKTTLNAATSETLYTGFNTRPTVNAAAVNSPQLGGHPPTGDCSLCHGSTDNFSAIAKGNNHIPTAPNALCQSCHTNVNATNKDYSSPPSHLAIHANGPTNTSTNCAQCHDTANSAKYSRAAVNGNPAYTVVGATTKGVNGAASSHVPYSNVSNCTGCHTAAATTSYTSFAGGLYSHTGITTGCETCHGAPMLTTTFQGTLTIVTMTNYLQGPGTDAHIPAANNATCEDCHKSSVPAGLVSAVAANTGVRGTGFYKNALPTTGEIHSKLTSKSDCLTCHESTKTWGNMAQAYPRNYTSITPLAGAKYQGFNTRPISGGGGFSIANATHPGGKCGDCHESFDYFDAVGKPTGHIPTPTTSVCTACHNPLKPGDYSIAGLNAPNYSGIHPGMVAVASGSGTSAIAASNCITCHSDTTTAFGYTGCKTQDATNCAAPVSNYYFPKGVGGNLITASTGAIRHVPTGGLNCAACHSDTTFSAFNKNGAGAAGYTMGLSGHNAVAAIKMTCQSCHLDKSATMIMATGGATTNYGLPWSNTNPSFRTSAHSSSKASVAKPNTMAYPNDCNTSGCHTYTSTFKNHRGQVRPTPVIRATRGGLGANRLLPNQQTGITTRGSLGNTFDHQGVEVGKCKTCHDGKQASGMPARHLMVTTSCDTCHRTTVWLPAQFSHNGISRNTCQACHNGLSASTRPAGHFMTPRSCDSCHKTVGWKPVSYSHLSPNFRATADAQTCVTCHLTNSEIIPRQARAQSRVKPVVGP